MLVLLTLACSQDITVQFGQEGCEDYDFADPQPSDLDAEWTGADAVKVKRRFDVLPQTSLVFDPDFEEDGELLHVREWWTGGEDDQEFCYQPYLLVSGITRGVELRWYEGEDQTPFATLELEP